MTPEKKQFLPFKAAAASIVAMGVFAQANSAEPDAAPVVIAAVSPDAALSASLAKVVTPEPSKITRFKPTSGFGDRPDPFDSEATENHKGTDFAGPAGTPVLLPLGPGKVMAIGSRSGWGKFVDISYGTDNQGDDIMMRFAHLGRTSVRVGEEVAQGKQIGIVGDTGHSTGPHVHVGLYVNGIAVDLVTFDSTTVKSWTVQPTAELLDVEKKGRGRHATYSWAPGEGTPILVALDPQMPAIISRVRELEKPQKPGDSICIPHDGNKELTCGGINGLSQNIKPEVLAQYTDKDLERTYEGLYVTCGVRRVPAVEKLIYFNDCVNFGPAPTKDMLAKAGNDTFLLLKLGSLRYDLIMEKNPGLRDEYRDGWNSRQLTLFTENGFEARHKFKEIELISRYPSHERGLTEVTVLAKKIPEKAQPTDFGRDNLPGENAAPSILASTAPAPAPAAVMKASDNAAFVSNKTTAEIIGGTLALMGLLAASLAWGDGILSKIKAIPAVVRARRKKAEIAAAMREAPATVVPLKKRETTRAEPSAIPVRATSAPEVIKPALIEAAQAASRRDEVAHIEPRMTVPADIPVARQEPKVTTLPEVEVSGPTLGRTTVVLTPREAVASQAAAGAPPASEVEFTPRVAAAMREADSIHALRGKRSMLPGGKGWRVDYADESSMTVEKHLVAMNNVRPEADRVVARALEVAEQIQKDNINVRINYSNGSSMTVEKDRVAVHNAQSAEDIEVERALRIAADRFKGNFKISVKGDTARQRANMAMRVKTVALRLGLADQVVLVWNDDAARVVTMRARTAGPEVKAHRPTATTAEPDFLELKRA